MHIHRDIDAVFQKVTTRSAPEAMEIWTIGDPFNLLSFYRIKVVAEYTYNIHIMYKFFSHRYFIHNTYKYKYIYIYV